jgi:hypothetical protein
MITSTLPDPRYMISPDGKAITCGKCGLTSHNLHDVRHRFCGKCNLYHDDCSVEFDCTGCGRHIFQFGGPLSWRSGSTRRCTGTLPLQAGRMVGHDHR